MAGFFFRVKRNDIAPRLTKLIHTAQHPQKVLRAMGTTFMSITMGTFNDAGADFRPKPWAPKKDGTPSKLQKSGTLSRSFHLEVTDDHATVSNPVVYAATHQFGRDTGRGAPIPARPFFPILDNKLTKAAEDLIAAAGKRAIEKDLESSGE